MTAHQPFVVESRSLDGNARWEWSAVFVARAPSLIVLQSAAGDSISSGDRSYAWPADTLQFYWTDRWYNIRAALRDGEPYFYSCNVAMPATLDDGRLSYVDLDLEIAVTDALSATLEGEEDFARNTAGMAYPPDVIQRARDAAAELRSLVRAGRPPFRNYESLFLLKRAL